MTCFKKGKKKEVIRVIRKENDNNYISENCVNSEPFDEKDITINEFEDITARFLCKKNLCRVEILENKNKPGTFYFKHKTSECTAKEIKIIAENVENETEEQFKEDIDKIILKEAKDLYDNLDEKLKNNKKDAYIKFSSDFEEYLANFCKNKLDEAEVYDYNAKNYDFDKNGLSDKKGIYFLFSESESIKYFYVGRTLALKGFKSRFESHKSNAADKVKDLIKNFSVKYKVIETIYDQLIEVVLIRYFEKQFIGKENLKLTNSKPEQAAFENGMNQMFKIVTTFINTTKIVTVFKPYGEDIVKMINLIMENPFHIISLFVCFISGGFLLRKFFK